jgi:tetratricopeptide (TPR) repeat protein
MGDSLAFKPDYFPPHNLPPGEQLARIKQEGQKSRQLSEAWRMAADELNRTAGAVNASRAALAAAEGRYDHWRSGAYFFEDLPAGIASAKTDAEGRFVLTLPRSKRFALAARGTRAAGGTTEKYYWLFWVTMDAKAKRILVSNDTLWEVAHPDAVVRLADLPAAAEAVQASPTGQPVQVAARPAGPPPAGETAVPVPSTAESALPAAYQQGAAMAKAGDWPGAERAYRDALRTAPGQPAIWYGLGDALGKQERVREAIAALREAVTLKADYTDAWYRLGLYLSKDEQYAEALAALTEVTRLEPHNPRGWRLRGSLHIMNKQNAQAVSALEEGVRLSPSDAEMWHYLGYAHALLNNKRGAAEAYERLKQLDATRAGKFHREVLSQL